MANQVILCESLFALLTTVPYAWAPKVVASLAGKSPGVYELAPDLEQQELAFRVLGVRADKADPNQRRTVEATIANVVENLTLEDLEAAMPKKNKART